MSLQQRLAAIENAMRERAKGAGDAEFLSRFREINPDHADLLPRLIRANGADLAGAFKNYFGLDYDSNLTWRANGARFQLPPGAIPTNPSCFNAGHESQTPAWPEPDHK